MFNEPLLFNSSFNLEFDDYNNDGDLDFTIGQYGSSNGNVYKIFTLKKDGKVELLPIKDHSELFISKTTGKYSTKLNKINGDTFEIEYYNNAEGTFHDFYNWDGKQFVLLKKQKITQEEDLNADNTSFDINVSIKYKVEVDEKLKGINPNIIKATRQAIFDYDSSNAKFFHYKRFNMDNQILIFDIKERGKDTWEVGYKEKIHTDKGYEDCTSSGYCFATVEKQKSGSYYGYIVNSGGPCIKGDETY